MAEVAEKVKEVFKEKYQKEINIHITGNEPAETNNFSISLEKLKQIGFTEDKNFTLESEIAELFNYLQTK